MHSTSISKKSDKEIHIVLQVARSQLTKETPFFGIISSHMRIIPVSESLKGQIKTAAITPTGICMYNPDFIRKLSFPEVKGLLVHEASHPAFNFWEQFDLRDLKTANKAHDYQINMNIVDSPLMELPKGGLYEERFRRMSAMEIFFILEKESKQNKAESSEGGEGGESGESDQGAQGDSYTLEDDIKQEIIDQIEKEYYSSKRSQDIGNDELSKIRQNAKQDWKDTLEKALIEDRKHREAGNQRGAIPAHMREELEGILHPKLNFDNLLKRFFGHFGSPARPSFKHRNRRNTYLPNTFVKPRLIANKPKLYFLLDTSGSMLDTEGKNSLRSALGMMKRLITNGNYEVVVVLADADVQEEIEFSDVLKSVNGEKQLFAGGGGSDFRSAFERIWERAREENQSQAPIICVTDGAIAVPEAQPKIRTATAWVTPKGVQPPTEIWGEHMELDN